MLESHLVVVFDADFVELLGSVLYLVHTLRIREVPGSSLEIGYAD
jgi:hypothetical protein